MEMNLLQIMQDLHITDKQSRRARPRDPWSREFKYGSCPRGWHFLPPGTKIERGDRTFHVSDSTYIPCQASVGRIVDRVDEVHFIRENR